MSRVLNLGLVMLVALTSASCSNLNVHRPTQSSSVLTATPTTKITNQNTSQNTTQSNTAVDSATNTQTNSVVKTNPFNTEQLKAYSQEFWEKSLEAVKPDYSLKELQQEINKFDRERQLLEDTYFTPEVPVNVQ